MENQENKEIIEFGNTLNPNSNSKKFNDLTKDNQINNNIQSQNNNQNVISNVNQQVNNQQNVPNMNMQPSNNLNQNNMQHQNNIPNQNITVNNVQENNTQKVNNNVVTINNQEVVNLDDYKEDNRFRAKAKVETPEEKQNKKNAISTVIVIVVLVLIIFGIIVVVNKFLANNKIDNNNALTFVSNAESFITDAKTLVKKDTLSSKDLNFAPSCTDETKKETIISLEKILSNINDNKISPFGGEYNLVKSYIKVVAKNKNDSCVFEYYLYLTDNNYSVGTENNPIISDKITKEEVKKNSK